MENQIIHFLPTYHTKFLKSTNFTLSSLVLALFLSSNVTYAAGEVTIGDNPMASPYGVAIGSEAKASGSGSVAIGAGADSKENLGISVGDNTTAMGESSVVIGASGIAEGKQSVALGANSRAKNDNEVNIGIWSNDGLKLYGTRTLSGLSAGTKDDEAVNKKQLDTAIASISGGVSAEEAQKMADTAQNNAVTEAKTHTDTEINKVLKSGSSTANGGFSIGDSAQATGDNSIATGLYAQATGLGSTATGSNTVAAGINSIATGIAANAKGDNSIATGVSAHAEQTGSVATGAYAYATGVDSTATGNQSIAKGKNSVALGANAVAKNDNEVNIGIWTTNQGGAFSTQTGTRTLSGLSDGVNPDEAVNKGQLDT
ncbi:hypothetical protein M5796_004224, partial [Salmonella enterica]|nr:hypothetical protein [Salmonella enterica]EJE9776268.1 hypothetical protein [Salmonella enterica]EJF5536535.1 hypothetical protein [Salmonella enterica]EJX5314653.1 hypothetical protein [Salmonella enterica]